MVLLLKGLIMRASRSIGYALLAIGYLAQHQDEDIVSSKVVREALMEDFVLPDPSKKSP
jgi:hypothetical protein